MITLTPNDTVLLHTLVSKEAGTLDGLRDRGLLESAVHAQNAAFAGLECYPTVPEKASRLFFSLVSNHAFADGNKRVGLLAYLTTLKLNGIPFTATDGELIDLTLSLAEGKVAYEDLLTFTRAHIG